VNEVAVSSWALHRTLGISYPDSPSEGRSPEKRHSTGATTPLLQLPAELARRGFGSMQLCHFHLPSRDASYLQELRASLSEANVRLLALLVDDGDVSHPEHAQRDAAWIAGWLETGEALGAERARVIAGKQSASEETLDRAAGHLARLAEGATGLRLETENWYDLLATPDAVHGLLDRLDGKLGLCADWGNWPRPRKYADLPLILPRAETCHAKLDFASPEVLDQEDAAACIEAARAANFTGPLVIVNGGMGDSEWDALEMQREAYASL